MKDLNEDSFAALLTATGTDPDPVVSFFDGGTLSVDSPTKLRDDFEAFPADFTGGIFVG